MFGYFVLGLENIGDEGRSDLEDAWSIRVGLGFVLYGGKLEHDHSFSFALQREYYC